MFRYKAIMNPLSERSSKTSAKIIIACLWASSIILASPMLFYFKFTYVFDELNGGLKPFCTLASGLIGTEEVYSAVIRASIGIM